MKRMILAELASWRDKSDRKPLLLTGVRQCGKTYILQKFGREYFDDVAYVNLERNPEIGRVFEQNFDPQRIIDELGNLFLGRPILPGKTLLILDEIQTQPVAISALKYFCEDIPELAVIGAGSLLGVSLRREEASFPVGKVDRLQMYPMNFCEFMWASGYENYQDMLRKHPLEERVPDYVMSKMERLFYEYLVVGGMPEAVAVWVRSKDLAQVADIQDNILFGYENDFAKYAPVSEYTNIRAIWRSVPEQLARENNKFVFSRVKKSARAKDLEQSIGWLVDAGLIHLVNKVENAQIPLSV
ncbi:MAG: ATP-binding protein, partial [Clostridiaceae bacterium]|nr:ATP-binding protein [Clostridiaceae bacterium]